MTMHSKGPWRVSDKAPDTVVTDDPTGQVFSVHYPEASHLADYGGYCVAESIAPQDRPLIAAAPDLLEAAVKAERFIRAILDGFVGEGLEVANYHQNGNLEDFDTLIEGEMDGDELKLLQAAIAKATGQEVKA